MHITDYKACLFDVDRTLTTSKREILPATQEILTRLHKRGMKIGVCTGRHFATLQFALQFFPNESLHVVSEGAQVINSQGYVYWEQLIPPHVVELITKEALKENLIVVAPQGDTVFTNREDIPSEEKMTKRAKLAQRERQPLPVLVVSGVHERFTRFLATVDGITFKEMTGYSGKQYVDIMRTGINKSTGIVQWCNLQGVKPTEIIGFGDSVNDIEFLKSVGFAVAMGNADESVKRIAHEIIGSSDEDGIAVFFTKLGI